MNEILNFFIQINEILPACPRAVDSFGKNDILMESMYGGGYDMRAVKKIAAICCAVLVALCCVASLTLSGLLLSDRLTESAARVRPSYEREDLYATLGKAQWTEEDYAFLYRQTGLGAEALDELKGDNKKIVSFQEALFAEWETEHFDPPPSPVTSRDILKHEAAPIAPLKAGDVLVSSACHIFGWRHGHAAIVINSGTGTTLECISLDVPSAAGSTGWFGISSNFMALRLKAEYRERVNPAEVASAAWETLRDIPYDFTVGVLSPKYQGERPASTQCGHLVWQAYINFGLDVDSDGGAVCSPQDIARSPYFDVVQVFGFDPLKLW